MKLLWRNNVAALALNRLHKTSCNFVCRQLFFKNYIFNVAHAFGFAAVAFFEITRGGIILAGDDVTVSGVKIGELVGYDMNHMPNHMGILIRAPTVDEPPLAVGEKLVFHRPV